VSVLVVGDVVTDVLAVLSGPLAVGSDTPAEVRLTAGGSAANTAVWLARAGAAVTLAATVGDDPAGEARLAELSAAGVRLAVRRCPGASTGTVVVLTGPHERSMLCDRGANLLLAPSDVDDGLAVSTAAHVHLSGYTLFDERSRTAGRYALAEARRRGLTTSVDAASAAPLHRAEGFLDWVRGADLLFANLDEARVLTGRSAAPADQAAALAGALAEVAGAAVVKRGADGAVWARGTDVISVPAEPAVAVDPTGAGDAFAAGLLAAWLAGEAPLEALRAGARLGALAVGTVGGRPAA